MNRFALALCIFAVGACALTTAALASTVPVFTSLYSFPVPTSQDPPVGNSDGAYPLAGLTQGNDGDFYGTTTQGGILGNFGLGPGSGTIFKITPTGR